MVFFVVCLEPLYGSNIRRPCLCDVLMKVTKVDLYCA